MIIAMGLILLMTMGIIHDNETFHVMRERHVLRNVCGEMADAAAFSLMNGETAEQAEKMAADILRKNPEVEAVWEMKVVGNTITVKVRGTEYPNITYKTERKIKS